MIGSTGVDSAAAGCDDADSDVIVLFLFFLVDSAATATSFKPAACTHNVHGPHTTFTDHTRPFTIPDLSGP